MFSGGRPSPDSGRKFMLTTNLRKVHWSCGSKRGLWHNIPQSGWSSWSSKHRASVGSSQLGLLMICWTRILNIYGILVYGTILKPKICRERSVFFYEFIFSKIKYIYTVIFNLFIYTNFIKLTWINNEVNPVVTKAVLNILIWEILKIWYINEVNNIVETLLNSSRLWHNRTSAFSTTW